MNETQKHVVYYIELKWKATTSRTLTITRNKHKHEILDHLLTTDTRKHENEITQHDKIN